MSSHYGNDLVIAHPKISLAPSQQQIHLQMQDIVLISIPESTIRNIVEQAVRKVISETQTAPAVPADGKQLLTRKEAAELAGVCVATLDNKVKDGVLRKYRTGGVVRFRQSEVIEAFSQPMFHNGGRKGKSLSRAKKA